MKILKKSGRNKTPPSLYAKEGVVPGSENLDFDPIKREFIISAVLTRPKRTVVANKMADRCKEGTRTRIEF